VFGSILGVLAGAALLIAGGVMVISALAGAWLQESGLVSQSLDRGSNHVISVDLRTADLAILDALETFHHAAGDPQARGVVVLAGGDRILSPADGEALSRALTSLAQANRSTIGYLEDADAAGLPAYLALSPVEVLWASPFAAIRPAAAQQAEPLERAIMGRAASHIVQLIADARGLPADRVDARFALGPLNAQSALEFGLIDQTGSAAAAIALAQSGADSDLIAADQYLRSMRADSSEDHVKLIALDGPVGSSTAAHAAAALDAAAAAPSVRAVVLYADAAGGSVPAAFEIADAITRAQAAGTPVIALAGSAATGAGYFAIAPADRIITPAAAAIAGLGAPESRLPDELSARSASTGDDPSARIADARYGAVLESVARARDLPLARMDALGRGQVWSGQEAVAFGLADQIGGLDEALAQARSLAGVAADEPLTLQRAPDQSRDARPPLDRFLPRRASP
jgi:ClpP class serine protease